MVRTLSNRSWPLLPDDGQTVVMSRSELLARLEAMTQRKAPPSPAVLRLHGGKLVILAEKRIAKWRGRPLRLTPREFDILLLLARHSGKVLSRDFLFDSVWSQEFAGEGRLVDGHIMRLRKKLGDGAHLIEAARGVGYRLSLALRIPLDG